MGHLQPLVTMASVNLKQKCTLKRLLRDAKGPSQRDGRKSQPSEGKERERASKVQGSQSNTNVKESSGHYRLILSEEWKERGRQQKAGSK